MYQIHMKSCERWKLHGEPWRELLLIANRWANHPRPLPLRRKCARAVQLLFPQNGSLEPLILKSWRLLRLLLCNPDAKGIHWTPKMFVVCLQTPWILPACWQDGSMIASVCTIWMDVLWQLNICPNGIILFVDRKRHQLILKLSQDLPWFSPFPSVSWILSISSRNWYTHTALKGPIYLRVPYSPTSLSCMVCQPQVTSLTHRELASSA